jgi:hypothetical protein
MSSLKHNYYEAGVVVEKDKSKRSYLWKLCNAKKITKYIRCTNTTTSNLISHLQSQLHAKEYEDYLQKIQDKENETPFKGRAF